MPNIGIYMTVSRYAQNVPVLDALWQWQENQAGRSAGYAFPALYSAITANLSDRYGPEVARAAVSCVEEECGILMELADVGLLQAELRSALSGPAGEQLRQRVIVRTYRCSPGAKALLTLIHAFDIPAFAFSDDQIAQHGPALRALVRSVGGRSVVGDVDLLALRQELAQCGVLHRLYWLTAAGEPRATYAYGPVVPFLLGDLMPSWSVSDVAEYLAGLFHMNRLSAAMALEEVARSDQHGWPGVRPGIPEGLAPLSGLLGFDPAGGDGVGYVAVNPLLRAELLRSLAELKAIQTRRLALVVGQSVAAFAAEVALGAPMPLPLGHDRRAWQLTFAGQPPLVVFVSSWLTQSDLTHLWSRWPGPPDLFCIVTAECGDRVAEACRSYGQPASVTLLRVGATEGTDGLRQICGTAHSAVPHLQQWICRS
ncbi:MAG: hypothetical protein ACM3XM_06115 [Mycobacterium leprae]